MASKADVEDARWAGWQEGRECAAQVILDHLIAVDAPPELRAMVAEVAQPDYDYGVVRGSEIDKIKTDRRLASENHDKAIQAVRDAGYQLSLAAVMAASLGRLDAAEKSKEVGDRLDDEATQAIHELLYSYRDRRINTDLPGDADE
jgi:hypothetical protein